MPPSEMTIEAILDDPPRVHTSGVMSRAPAGVWGTDRALYELLARCCAGEVATLETGCGISTVLFSLWTTSHTCITPSQDEVTRVQEYCAARDISTARVEFIVGPSDEVLPTLRDCGSLDVVLIDGGHAFPLPIIDWYYTASRMRAGAIALIDDIHLQSVSSSLVPFLDRDPRWQRVAGTAKWAAFHKLSSDGLRDEWGLQVGLGIFEPVGPRSRAEAAVRQAYGRLRSRVRRTTSPT